jgi:hypothetical protein
LALSKRCTISNPITRKISFTIHKQHNMKISGFALLTLLFLAGCQSSTDEFASPTGEHNITQRAPRAFRASLQSSADVSSFTSCSGDIPDFAIPDHFLAGQATHLGNLNGALSTLHHDDCDISFATLQLTASVSGQLAAANGDLVFYTGEDVIDLTSLLTETGTTGAISGTWIIDGGTGRFAGASGSFTITGIVDFVTGTFSAVATGTINY